jgi:SAM-dependent methyltransferase
MPHKVIDVFERLAPRYDEVLPFFRAMATEIVDALPIGDGTRVLDLGAGTGALTARAMARGALVTAIDAAPAMIARLRQEHPGVSAHVMDAHDLRFPDESFDVVMAGFVMHVLDDPDAAARGVRRVLSPGGVFAFTAPGPPPGMDLPPQPGAGLWAEFEQYLPPGGGIGRPLNGGALLGDTGFTGVAAHPVSVDLPMPGGGETLWRWHLSHGSAGFINDLPPDRRDEFRQRLVAATDEAGVRALRITTTLWTGRKAAE